MHRSPGDIKQSVVPDRKHSLHSEQKNIPVIPDRKIFPSFRTAFFADPESRFFNGLLDTGSGPV